MPEVILPALNEAAALPTVLKNLPVGYRAIVVDNGSTDGTADVAASLGALVVHASQRGFGAACWAGLQAVTDDIVCFMDADASFDAAQLPLVADPIIAGTADLVLGARQHEAGSWPWHARVANRVLAMEIRRRTHLPMHDLGPMRAMRTDALRGLDMQDRRSGWPLEMLLRAHRSNWRIEEVTVSYRPRIGKSKVTGTVKGTVRAIGDMSKIMVALK